MSLNKQERFFSLLIERNASSVAVAVIFNRATVLAIIYLALWLPDVIAWCLLLKQTQSHRVSIASNVINRLLLTEQKREPAY